MLSETEAAAILRGRREANAVAELANEHLARKNRIIEECYEEIAQLKAQLSAKDQQLGAKTQELMLSSNRITGLRCDLDIERDRSAALARERDSLKGKNQEVSQRNIGLERETHALKAQVVKLASAFSIQIARTDGLWSALKAALPYIEKTPLGEKTGLRYADGTPQTVLWKIFDAAFDDTARSRGLKDPHLYRDRLEVEEDQL